MPEQGIPNRSADAPGFETGILEPISDLEYGRWRMQSDHDEWIEGRLTRGLRIAFLAARVKMVCHFNLGVV
jgi:hypothetical protein